MQIFLERDLPMSLPKDIEVHTSLLGKEVKMLLLLRPYNKLSYTAMINSPKISEWNNSEADMVLIKTFLGSILMDIISYFNVNKNLSPNQGIMLADTIIANYRNMTLPEFIDFRNTVFAGNVCGNDYKPVFDRIDGGLIIEWLRFYLEHTGHEKIKARQDVYDIMRRNSNKAYYENNKAIIDKEASENREYILRLPVRELEHQKVLAKEYQEKLALLLSQMQID